MRIASEQSATLVVEKVEDGGGDKDKEKKKNKRRSARRSKQNSSNIASSSVTETRGELSQSPNEGKTKNYTTSMDNFSSRQPDFEGHALSEQGMTSASDVAFNSMPAMRINEQNEHPLPFDLCGQAFSNSCPEPILDGVPFAPCKNSNMLPIDQANGSSRGKIFTPFWSAQAVEEALVKGDAFKALFRVNAHNRLEAYCKIEGVPTDVLISGIAAQNRAVEGDMVVIKIDPLELWPKMKGSNGPPINIPLAEAYNLASDSSAAAGGSYKGKNKVGVDDEYAEFGDLPLQKGTHLEVSSCVTEVVHEVLPSQVSRDFGNGSHSFASYPSRFGSSTGQNEAVNGVDKLCTMVSSYPSKRPTGMVVAIVETSSRRDAIVGFLNVKQWLYCKKDAKKKKYPSLISSREYIQFTPTDPKFPKMMVLIKSLPDSIKERLKGGDETIEMELVAAQIDNWEEESPFPQAHVSRIFGRGSEMESRMNAILYENAICCSEFSPESLSCLPCNTWQVPEEEISCRRDVRSLCVFTIDPSTATDLDDALSFERLPNGTFRVGVHIADVSYFVLPDTALDVEARLRSTSVYMLRGKLPMLPPLLSENIGSLNPGVDRLAFSIFWELSGTGDVIDRWVGRTVIRSCCKLSYEQAQDMVDGKISEEACNMPEINLPLLHGPFKWSNVISSVRCLHEISKTLRERRFDSGALQLESSKVSFLFDEYGVPTDSMICEPLDSNFLVEEFTLLANTTAAEIVSRAFPDSALLRRHPEPNMRKLRDFEAFCSKHGLELDVSSSGHFYRSLERIKEKLKDDCVLIDILMSYASRPMQLATYFCSGVMKDNMGEWGHYALAVPVYTHFTSPLRRYPDIVVHRTLAAAIEAEGCLGSRRMPDKLKFGQQVTRIFTGLWFDKNVVESVEGREALSAAALKHGVPCTESLADVAAYCNERKLASRHVKDGCDKLYMWILLKKKEVIFSEARVLGLGPRFMSIYIQNLAIERRIYYDEVEGLTVEWLETTSTLVLSLCPYRRTTRKAGPGYYRALNEVASVINLCDMEIEPSMVEECNSNHLDNCGTSCKKVDPTLDSKLVPLVFPITVRLLSTIPVVLHAVGGDDGPIDIGVKLYTSSYFN